MKRLFTRSWSLLFLLSFLGVVCLLNYTHGTWLTGWDNLHPEFNFVLNIKRSFFAVWQEYQGLGLLGGMGHAADLPRQLMLWVLSFVLPTHLLRYVWTFGMLTLGSIGCYTLLKKTFKLGKITSLIGGLFYVTNLATVQMFSVPFEAFTTHFGFLPWLIFFFLENIDSPTKKSLIWFSILSLLSTPQAYVPTLFVVYLIALSIISLVKIRKIKNLSKLWAITFLLNAFWLIPFLYFTLTRSHIPIDAKINQMATEEVYLRNRAYGGLLDTIQLKGFWMDTWDFDPQKNQFSSVLGSWRNYANRPEVIATSVIFFVLTLLGASRANLWLLFLFLFGFTMLTTDIPPFSWINQSIRVAFPLFHQVFRFPFTKFSILTGLTYSLLLALGFHKIVQRGRVVGLVAQGILIVSLTIQSFPLFQGNLFYSPIREVIPKEYFDLFDYLKTQPRERIVNLPQSTYWSWSYYRWGYTGSGFFWYGIEQPILDRAFDVWSAENENYYWELSYALYSKDSNKVKNVLDKYDVRYVLLDENIISPSHNRALFTEEIKELLKKINVTEVARFGKLTVYERNDIESRYYVVVKDSLPIVSPVYNWTDNDVAYQELGDYIANPSGGYSYPYRSLFTKRSVSERKFVTSSLATSSASYDSDQTNDLDASKVTTCGLLKEGTATAANVDGAVRFTSLNQRGCLSFGISNLSHREGYLVAVENRHISGRPLLISFINQTAKHVELETYLSKTSEFTTNYFILPPLASDGLGYTVYLANDSIGRYKSINDIKRVRFYKLPYQPLVSLRTPSSPLTMSDEQRAVNFSVSHPNPAYYKIVLPSNQVTNNELTLILSQSYHPGWNAFVKTDTFPYFRRLNEHVLVNNWANAWILRTNDELTNDLTIVIFFLPQLLQWFGFLLLPVPFLLIWRHGPSN